jgi:hypothetical protein
MGVYLNETGLYSTSGKLIEAYTVGSHAGNRVNLGFFGAVGQPYVHIKTSQPHQGHKMLKFEYNGYTYSGANVHNSVTLYTYGPTATPHSPRLINWGDAGGIVNYYYSSDSPDYLVIVLQTSGAYTGGFLYCQSGRSHTDFSIDVLTYSYSANTSGVY